MLKYDIARKYHEYLWQTYGDAYDMTGAYVDQDDLQKLLENPTKKTAAECYCSQMEHFFQVGPDSNLMNSNNKTLDDLKSDPMVLQIAEELYCLDDLNALKYLRGQ